MSNRCELILGDCIEKMKDLPARLGRHVSNCRIRIKKQKEFIKRGN